MKNLQKIKDINIVYCHDNKVYNVKQHGLIDVYDNDCEFLVTITGTAEELENFITNSDYYCELRNNEITDAHINIITGTAVELELIITNSDYYCELRNNEITDAHINIIAWVVSFVVIGLTLYFILI